MTSRLWVSLWIFALLTAHGCATRKAAEPAPTEGVVETAPPLQPAEEELLTEEERKARVEEEYRSVMYERRLAHARAHLRAGQLGLAERAAEDALHFDPASREAAVLLRSIQSALGNRAATADDIIGREVADEEVRREERKAMIHAYLARARAAEKARNWEEAERYYERALYIASSPPRAANSEMQKLRDQLRRHIEELEGQQQSDD